MKYSAPTEAFSATPTHSHQMKQVVIYSLKVWLTTSVLSPVLITAVHFYFLSLNNYDPFRNAVIYKKELLRLLKSIAGSWIVFLPMALGLYYAVLLLSKRSIKLLYIKACLSVIGVILAVLLEVILLLFYLLSANPDSAAKTITLIITVHLMVCNALSVVVCIWFYKLTPTTNTNLKQTIPN